MTETISNVESLKTRHSKWIFLSNSLSQLPSTLISAVQGGFYLFYYQVVIGLNIWFVVLAVSIFMVYDATNNPIFGYLIDRNTRFTRKWGRRFPWIVVGIIPWTLSIYMLFSVPDVDVSANPWPVFGWLLLSLFVLDTFSTLVNINYSLLRPDKFRTEGERRTFAKYYTPIDIFAMILGMLFPAFFIDIIPGDPKTSYAIMGAMTAILSLVFAILSLPGNREDKIVIDMYYSTGDTKRMSFLKATKEAVKLKSFLVFFVFSTCYGLQITLVVVNLIYLITFVLQIGSDMYILVLGLYLAATLISLPLWIKYIKKINNNKKAFVVGGLAQCAALIPLSFFQGLFDLLIMSFILGFASGGLNAFTSTILFPSVVDDFAVRTGQNQKGILFGISAFLGRLIQWIDEVIFATVQQITGFIEGYDTYNELAAVVSNMTPILIGIRLLQGLIPALVLLVGVLVFWKFFPITQDVLLKNKAELEKLGL